MAKLQDKDKLLALLFANNTMSKKQLASSGINIESALKDLKESLSDSIFKIVESDSDLELALLNEASDYVNKKAKEDEKEELTDTAAQILTLIMYCSPISKADIDYIRGVNSATSLRKLLMRGLIEKSKHKSQTLYMPTTKLLADMGVDKADDLPDKDAFCKRIKEVLSLKYEQRD